MLPARWMNSLLPARTARRPLARPGKLWCDGLEDRTVLAANFASGAAVGEVGIVRVIDGGTQQQITSFLPYGSAFSGGVNVAQGDVTADGVADIITGTTTGRSHVRVFDGVTFQEVRSFLPYVGFSGGVNVAAGDVNGDGAADVITGAGAGGGPHVKVFDGRTGAQLQSFFAYDAGFGGGVNVAAGDVNGDGRADIVTGAGAGGGPHVKTFDGSTGAEVSSFIAFDPGFLGGVLVGIGADGDGDGNPDLTVGAAGTSHLKTFSSTGVELSSQFLPAGRVSGGVVFLPSNAAPVLGPIGNRTGSTGAALAVALTATDANARDTLAYSATNLPPGATLNGSTGAFTWTPASDQAGTFAVTFAVTDGTATDTETVTLTVLDSNVAPVITSNGGGTAGTQSVVEGATAVTAVTATDANAGSTLTYSIVGGADAALFAIDGSTGALTFLTAPDFETPADVGTDNVYDVTVQVSDGTLTDTQALAITVTDSNDNAPVLTSNGGGTTGTQNVPENTTAVTTVTATDADLPAQTLTYTIVPVGSGGGADAANFSIDSSTGVLTFIAAPDCESPTDAGANNVYDVTVQVSDGTNTDTQVLAVTVTGLNDNSPVLTSNGGGTTGTQNVVEGTTAVTTVTATDADAGSTLTYSLVGGADAALFAIDGSTGALTFLAAPVFASPADAGANNVYDVTVQVSDGTSTDTQALAVAVTEVNVAPIVTTSGGTAAYTVGDPPLVIDGGITVTDANVSDMIVGATVDSGPGNFAPGDVLAFDSALATGFGITGSYDGVTTGVLTFTGSATAAQYQAVLRTVTFATSVDATVTLPLTFIVNDGDTTGSDTRNVAVTGT